MSGSYLAHPVTKKAHPKPRDKLIVAGATWAVFASLGLALWVVFFSSDGLSGIAAVILLAPIVAAVLGYVRPYSRIALLLAVFLLAGTIVMLLIGLSGFLFVPSLILFLVATFKQKRRGVREGSTLPASVT